MLIVNQGVQGPRAVALQILLNRFGATGTPLKVDGHYGRKTASAVAAFRREILKSPGPGSSTDLAFWQSMLRLTQLQTIEAVDVTDPMLTETAVPELQKQKANPIMLGGTSNGVDQLMRLIGLEARGMGSVLLLRFHAHGGPGLVAVSHGTRKISPGIDPNHELTVLNEITVGKLRPVLESIAPIFANFGFVEFHACKVAQGGKGEKFLETLADIWRVPVTAPLSSQSATHAVFALSGATCTFYPGKQTLRQWAESRDEATKAMPARPMLQPVYAGGMCSMAY